MEQKNFKQDLVLKEFWRDNRRFADLFNTALFGGKQVIDPDKLEETDKEFSNTIVLKRHTETINKIIDLVKKTYQGVDFVIWGIENQQAIHYGMPLRMMVSDILAYQREYEDIARQRASEGELTGAEFLSRFRKGDRLHPMVSVCVYYGEDPWDGPVSLYDMLEIPDELKSVVNDYRMNLIQVRDSEQFDFQNEDVHIIFDMSRMIYHRDFQKIEEIYGNKSIPSELGIVIGAITSSKNLIEAAMASPKGEINMCNALKELENKGRAEGMAAGRAEGMAAGLQDGKAQGIIKSYKSLGGTKAAAIELLKKECGISQTEAEDYIQKYW